MRKKMVSVVLVLAMAVCMMSGCGTKEEPATPVETKEPAAEAETGDSGQEAAEGELPGAGKTIAFVPKQLGNPYFVAVRDAVEEAAVANGFEFKCNAPDSSIEVDKQISICEAFIAEGVDVLIVIPNDATAIVDVINSASEK